MSSLSSLSWTSQSRAVREEHTPYSGSPSTSTPEAFLSVEMFESLPFSEQKQQAVLGHGLLDDSFFRQARAKILPEWFNDPYCSKVWKAKVVFFSDHGRAPTIEELKETPSFLNEERAVKEKMEKCVEVSVAATLSFKLDVLSKDLSEWLKSRIYHVAVEKSASLYNQQQFEEAYAISKVMTKELDEARFHSDLEVNYDDPMEDIRKSQLDIGKALTLGHPLLDKALLPEANGNGSLLPGDTTVVLAATNAGKTTFEVTVAAANIKRGKYVLFLQHEDSEANLKTKILCAMVGASRTRIFELYNTPEGMLRIEKAAALIRRFLVHVRYVKAGASVEDVEAIYRRKQDEQIAKTGEPFHLHCNDYPAKLITSMAKGGQWQKRTMDDYVYDYFIQLGSEYGTHNILPIQTNREGAKVNKGVSGKGNGKGEEESHRLLFGEDVSESYGVIQKASNLITINRTPLDKIKDYVTFLFDKSRTSGTGIAVVCKSAYARSITHGLKVGKDEDEISLGAMSYYGTNSITHRNDIQELMRKYDGTSLPIGIGGLY